MKSLLEFLGSKTEETIKTLDEIVRIRTAVPPGENYRVAIELMAGKLKALGFNVEIIPMQRELFEKE